MLTCTQVTDRKQLKALQKQDAIKLSDHLFTLENSVTTNQQILLVRRTEQDCAKLLIMGNKELTTEFELAEVLAVMSEPLAQLGVTRITASCLKNNQDSHQDHIIALSKNDKLAWRQQLNETWHQTIPLSKAMNITASYYNNELLTVTADKAFNQNLHNTMFAGSIYSHATLTGWGWVYLQLKGQQLEGSIVLADAEIKYLKPIVGQPLAQTRTTSNQLDVSPLSQGKNAQAKVIVHLLNGSEIAAVFHGRYAILPVKKCNG